MRARTAGTRSARTSGRDGSAGIEAVATNPPGTAGRRPGRTPLITGESALPARPLAAPVASARSGLQPHRRVVGQVPSATSALASSTRALGQRHRRAREVDQADQPARDGGTPGSRRVPVTSPAPPRANAGDERRSASAVRYSDSIDAGSAAWASTVSAAQPVGHRAARCPAAEVNP